MGRHHHEAAAAKKKAPAQDRGISKNQHGNSTAILHPRVRRLALALVRAGAEGISREQADRIAPASNGPHYMGILRELVRPHITLAPEQEFPIDCARVYFMTFDGFRSWHGQYRPNPAEIVVLRVLLEADRAARVEPVRLRRAAREEVAV